MSEPGHPRDLLGAYLDDELTIEERSFVDRHLALCSPCREKLASLAALSRAVAEEPIPDPPADLAARIGRAIDDATVVPMRRRRRFVVPASIAATIAAVGLVVLLQGRQPAPEVEPRRTQSPPPPPATNQAPAEPDRRRDTRQQADRAEPTAEPEVGAKSKEDSAFAPEPPVAPPVEEQARIEAKAEAQNETPERLAAAAPSAPAPAPSAAEGGSVRDVAAMSRAAPSPCAGDRWVDAGTIGLWTVDDVERAVQQLRSAAGRSQGRVERLDPQVAEFALIVPRSSLASLVETLRRLGVSLVSAEDAPAEGFECVRVRVTLEVR